MWWRLTKTAIFSVLAPGTVGVLIPFWLRRSAAYYFPIPPLQNSLGNTDVCDRRRHLFVVRLGFCGEGIRHACADRRAQSVGRSRTVSLHKESDVCRSFVDGRRANDLLGLFSHSCLPSLGDYRVFALRYFLRRAGFAAAVWSRVRGILPPRSAMVRASARYMTFGPPLR